MACRKQIVLGYIYVCIIYDDIYTQTHRLILTKVAQLGKNKFRKKSFQITLIIWGYKVGILSISEQKWPTVSLIFLILVVNFFFTGELTLLQDVYHLL